MFLALTIIFFYCLYKLLRLFQKTEGLFSTFGIFAVIYVFYNILIPLECYVTNDYSLYGNGQDITLTYPILCLIMVFSILGILGFGFGYYFSRFNPYVSDKIAKATPKIKMPLGTPLIGILSILVILVVYRSELQSSQSYEGNYTTTYENPLYALLIKYFLFYLGISCAFYLHMQKRLNVRSVIFLVIGVFFGLYTSSKAQVLIVVTGLLAFLILNPPKKMVRFVVVTTSLFFLMAAINVGFGYYRYAKGTKITADDLSDNSISVLRGGVFKSTDARGPMFVIGTILKKDDEKFKFGMSYLQLFTIVVPKAIWPDRPYDLAEEFARENMSGWTSGQGLGYSYLVEGYVNFGVLGVFIHFAILGLIWGWVWSRTKKVVIKYASVEYWYSFYFTIGTYVLFLVDRNTFAGNIKTLLMYVVPFVILLRVFKAKKIKNASALGS